YLTGFPEPEAVAVLSPHGSAPFTLFVRPRDPEREVWTGERIGVERAGELFGADEVFPIDELEDHLSELLKPASRIYYPIGSGDALEDHIIQTVIAARRTRARSGQGPSGIEDLDALLSPLRLIKDADELSRMRVAADIGVAGHLAAMRRARPGVGEWELRAALEAEFIGAGGRVSFPSIVASGHNATVLHYEENRCRMGSDDLVLIDAGAEWGGYSSDISRTFPVSGRFTRAQRDLYDVVLAAEEAAIVEVRPGALFTTVHEAAVRILAQGMLDLGLLPAGDLDGVIERGEYRQFYLHQTSHWLGLDVHDAGPYQQNGAPITLVPGMVLTIEPGLYIPADEEDVPERFRGIGIRIEDDVAVTEDGGELLTRGVPVDPEKVEEIIRGGE
ncbi:MAG: aminopeptidase P N-terminal domain-containing protein, partial [Gemmatimonadota bacterium]|nr:aminopeptidase P N-terminal domain-containing protein [Gemmatimonadota bacterium]